MDVEHPSDSKKEREKESWCMKVLLLSVYQCVYCRCDPNLLCPVRYIQYLFLLVRPGSLLLCQYHLSLSSDLNTLPQGLLQLLDALHLLTQRVL